MNRIKHIIFTVLSSALFIYGSILCARYGERLHGSAKGSLLLFCAGLTVILIGCAATSVLIKLAHPEHTALQTVAFSVFTAFIIHGGTQLIMQRPVISGLPFYSTETFTFYFGIYLVVFGIAMLSFLIKT